MTGRETIYQALFDQIKGLPGLVTASRRPRLAKDVSPDEQPALFIEELPEIVHHQNQGLPPKYLLEVDVILYARLPEDQTTAPGAILNPLLDALQAALAPDEDEEDQTLGGLVQYCRISGKIDKLNGVVDGQAAAFVSIEIMTV